MKKNQKGFGHVALLLCVVVLLAAGFAGWKVMKANKGKENNQQSSSRSLDVQEGSGPNYKALAACTGGAVFDTLPTTLADYDQIIPLGNIGVPDHTFPTDHLYFAFKHIGNTVTNPDLMAPGKIVVVSITNSGEKKNGVPVTDDYNIVFSPCKGLSFNFGHVQTLDGALADAVKGQAWDKPCDIHHPAAGEETHYCTKTTDILLGPGALIGKVGGKPQLGAFDLGAHLAGYKDPGYSNGSKWYPTTNAVCGLDYFDSATKAQLYAKVARTTEPRCGRIGQDKTGTAQGNWFATQDAQQGFNSWNMNLSIVHNNLYPSFGEVAVGGTISSPMVFTFAAMHSGTTNREPSEVTADGQVYCFQNENTPVQNNTPGTGKVLVQLSNNTTLKVEHQSGSCSSSENLSNPTTYYR